MKKLINIDTGLTKETTQGIIASMALFLGVSLTAGAEQTVVRIGHFPNITHAQALVAHHLSRQDKGWFEERLGPGVKVQWFTYNAGPSAMEALFADSIDLSFVGPNPAINAHLRSGGNEVRIVAGACSGGAALVVQADGRIQKDSDFKGKKVATDQSSRLDQALNYLRAHPRELATAYAKALAANAFLARDRNDSFGRELAAELRQTAVQGSDKTLHWTSDGYSVTYSHGEGMDVETTALAAMAISEV